MRTERRHGPRMRGNGTAYVNLDPDNGGIILNISEGGLSFESRAPIERTGTIRLWFSYGSRRIETVRGAEWDRRAGQDGRGNKRRGGMAERQGIALCQEHFELLPKFVRAACGENHFRSIAGWMKINGVAPG